MRDLRPHEIRGSFGDTLCVCRWKVRCNLSFRFMRRLWEIGRGDNGTISGMPCSNLRTSKITDRTHQTREQLPALWTWNTCCHRSESVNWCQRQKRNNKTTDHNTWNMPRHGFGVQQNNFLKLFRGVSALSNSMKIYHHVPFTKYKMNGI